MSEAATDLADHALRPVRIHKRAVLLGAILVVAVSYLALYVDLVLQQMAMGVLQFAPGAVGAFLIFYAGARLARALGFLKWMTPADFLIIYVMMFVGVFVCTRGLLEKLTPVLVYANYFSSDVNDYKSLVFPHLNPDLVVAAPNGPPRQFAAAAFFEGLGRNQVLPWDAWIKPCFCWLVLFALVIWVFLCITSILRRRWADGEKLGFPHTVLPLQLFDDGASNAFFRNKVTCFGIAVPMIIYLINGLHQNFPSFPTIPLFFPNLQQNFTVPPWNHMNPIDVFVSFAAIGLAFLLPVDLLFSLWFFFIVTRLGDVIGTATNAYMPGMPLYPCAAYWGYQSLGAYFALVAIYAYQGRSQFSALFRSALRGGSTPGDEAEMMSGRTAVYGVILGFVAIVAWSVWAGISLWVAAFVWFVYLFISTVVLTRGVAEAGILMTETSFQPTNVIRLFVNPASMGHGSLVGLSMLNAVFFRDLRGLFPALFMDAQQMAGSVRTRRRWLILPIFIAVLVAFVTGIATHLHLAYTHGALALYAYGYANAGWGADDAVATMKHLQTPFPAAPTWAAVGVVVTLVLSQMRMRFLGFPLYPIAYALAPTWTLRTLWFSIFVTWIIKGFMMRYAGQSYRKAAPFFLGLIVGEFGSVIVWAILSGLVHARTPAIAPF